MSDNMWESHWENVYGPNSDRARFKHLSEELKEFKVIHFDDYTAIFCEKIKSHALTHLINQFKQWRDVEEKLRKEDKSLEDWRSDRSKDIPLHERIEEVAARFVGWPPLMEDFPFRGVENGEESVEGDRSIGGLITTCPCSGGHVDCPQWLGGERSSRT